MTTAATLPSAVPVVLPVVRIDVADDGGITVNIDDQPYAADRSFTRDEVNQIVREITLECQSAVRIELTEADGTTYADITTPAPASEAPDKTARASGAGGADALGEEPELSLRGSRISGQGFPPGEQVALAYVLLHETADASGNTSVDLPPAALARTGANLVLIGLDSHRVAQLKPTGPEQEMSTE